MTTLTLPLPAQIVLNVPPDPTPNLLTNAEILNLLPGGRLGNDFVVGEDAVLNVQGGFVGTNLHAIAASTINLEAGGIGSGFRSDANSTVTISGGRLGDDAVIAGDLSIAGGSIGNSVDVTGGVTTIAGGRIGRAFNARENATVRMTGGWLDDVGSSQIANFEMRGGTVGKLSTHNSTFYGSDFRLDGRPIAGLDKVGDQVRFAMPEETVFTGVLADGTPFVFDVVYYEDDIRGPVQLVREDPPQAPAVINIPGDPVPYGIRDGQTLNLHPGGSLPDHFTAGDGSTLNVYGGRIGRNFESFGATVNIYDGIIGERIDSGEAFRDTVINMHGGRIDGGFMVWNQATLYLTGGQIGPNFHTRAGSEFSMSGGSVQFGFSAWHRSQFNLSGGRLARFQVSGLERPTLTIYGFDFELEREPVEGLSEPGDEIIIPRLDGTGMRLTGRLANGTSFSFLEDDQRLRNPVRLVLTEPPAEPAVYDLPRDMAPPELAQGETLNLRAGGLVADEFIAGPRTVVNIDGGQVGDNFQAVRSEVNIGGGDIGDGFDAFNGAVVTISGGTFGGSFEAYPGSTIVLEGTHFSLDGVPLVDLDEVGETLIVDTRGGQHLQAVLTDGSILDLVLNTRPDVLNFDQDYVDHNATLRLVVTASVIPEPSTFVVCCLMVAVIGVASRCLTAAATFSSQ